MIKYKTLKQESDEEWEKEGYEYKFPRPKYEEGTIKKNNGEMIIIPEFCPASGCNLFHADDMAKVLYNLRQPFEVNYIVDRGRDHMCQITIDKEHIINVSASGYGLRDAITFSSKFPDKLKFDICREMARNQASENWRYYLDELKDRRNKKTKLLNKKRKSYLAILSIIVNNARCYDDLKLISKIASVVHFESFYKRQKKKGKVKLLDKEIDWTKKSNEFFKEFDKLKKTEMYKAYQKEIKKITKKNKRF